MKTVLVTVEKTEKNYSAYTESLPGCVTTGRNMNELKNNMKEAIEGHIEVSREFGDNIPEIFEGKYSLEFILKSILTEERNFVYA